MPRPNQRTRNKKRVIKPTPGGHVGTHFRKKVNSTPHCVVCGKPLAGVAHASLSDMRGLNRSRRRIWRPYGGQVCHNCLKKSLRQAVRTA